MTVADIIEDAKYGELAQLGIAKQLDSANEAEQTIAEKKVLSYLNLGLIELYKRFALRTEEEVVVMSENITLYTITSATFNSLYGVFNELGAPYPVNDEDDLSSIMTPSYNVLQVPNPSEGGALYVLYNSAPDRIVWAADLTTLTVPIPPALLEAMLHYIGYRAHGAQDGNVQAENNTHYMRFEASCKRAEEFGVITADALVSDEKLEKRGWA